MVGARDDFRVADEYGRKAFAPTSATRRSHANAVQRTGQNLHTASYNKPMRLQDYAPPARTHPNAVCTMGSLKPFPGIVTAAVGRREATLDHRDLDPKVPTQMFRETQEASRRFATEEKCTVEWSRIWNIEPIAFDHHLVEPCDQDVREVSGASHRMPSGPLHDAAEVSRAGIPTVMMFVQSLRGISHNKIEDTREDHLEMSVVALDRLATKAANWILR